jgi:AcrR family transcriptional regulator
MAGVQVTKGKRLGASERRQLIEKRAAELFAERGYEATTLDEIAAACGVTKPILYRHFESKKALYLALLATLRERLLTEIVPSIDPSLPLAERFRAMVEGWFVYVEENPDAWKLLFRDTGGDAEIRAFQERQHDKARDVVGAIIESIAGASIPAEEVEPLAEFLRSALTRTGLWWLDRPDIPRSVMVASTARFLSGLSE